MNNPGFYVRKYRTEGIENFTEEELDEIRAIVAERPKIKPLIYLLEESEASE